MEKVEKDHCGVAGFGGYHFAKNDLPERLSRDRLQGTCYGGVMQLYIARHGLAVPKDEDPNCPLSKTGQRDIARMASFLARTCPSIKRIIHSGKIRAAQTALIYSETLGPGRIVEEGSVGLSPNDPTDPVISALSGWNEDTMLVSHLPLVGKLVARLVSSDESRDIVNFHAGAVTCLRHAEGNRGWTLAWAVSPDLLGS